MATRSAFSCLALIFALAALPWGLGATGPWATQGNPTPAQTADTAFGDLPVSPELTAASPTTGRALPIFLDSATAPVPPSDAPAPRERSRPSPGRSSSTPLYLSHCAFLC